MGFAAFTVAADLETYAGAQHAVDAVLQEHGRIDVAVHNVGVTIWAKPFWEYSPEEMEKEVALSLWPTLWSCRVVIPAMKAQGSGAIVNVGSIATRGINRVTRAADVGPVNQTSQAQVATDATA